MATSAKQNNLALNQMSWSHWKASTPTTLVHFLYSIIKTQENIH